MPEESESSQVHNPKALKLLGREPKMGGSKKPSFATAMTHQYDVVSEQTEVGLANIKHFFKFLEKLTEAMPQDFNKAVKGMRPLEGDMMGQYANASTQTESLVLQCLSRERDVFITINEIVVKPLAAFHAANLRQKRVLDADLAKFSKALKEAKQQLKKDESECKVELEKYLKMHSVQLELRIQTKEAAQGESTYEKFLSAAELEAFKQQQSTANADAAAKASPQYADYRKQRKKTFELFNKYDVSLQQARSAQLKFHEFLTSFLSELESMERYRLKTIDVFLRKLVTVFEAQSKFMQETVDGLQSMSESVYRMDDQQIQYSLQVWDFLYGACPAFDPIEYRLPCKANEIMDDYRTNFDTCPRPTAKKAYIPPKEDPPAFNPELLPQRIKVAASGRLQGDFLAVHTALVSEHGPSPDMAEWPTSWDLAPAMRSWRVVAAFKHFLESEFIAENLNFWIAVNNYRIDMPNIAWDSNQNVFERQLVQADWLYGEFITEGAPEEISLPKQIKNDIKKALDEATNFKQKEGRKTDEKGPDLTDIFNAAQESIFRLLTEAYEKFKQTKSFRWLQRAAKGGDNVNEEEACTSCGRMLIAGNAENVCIACKLLRQQPMVVTQQPQQQQLQGGDDQIDEESLSPVAAGPFIEPSPGVGFKPQDADMFALKTDLDALRNEYEALRIQVRTQEGKFTKPAESPKKPTEKPARPANRSGVHSLVTKAIDSLPPKSTQSAKTGEAKSMPAPFTNNLQSEPTKSAIVQQKKPVSEQREKEAKTTRVLGKGEFYCGGCSTLMKAEDNWCIECGLSRIMAAKASKS